MLWCRCEEVRKLKEAAVGRLKEALRNEPAGRMDIVEKIEELEKKAESID
jgi:hypothetical protein